MKKKPTVLPLLIDDQHPLPVTRRDFLSRGLAGVSTYFMAPTALGLILRENQARADGCPASGANPSLLPFLVFDLVGGAALSGNFVPLDRGGNPLPSYSLLGMGDSTNFPKLSVNTSFGAPMAGPGPLAAPAMGGGVAQTSKLLEGLISKTSLAAQANLRMGVICHNSQSDTANNQHSAIQQVAMAGAQGSVLRGGLGMVNVMSGANSDVPFSDSTLKPLALKSIADLTGALSYGPALSSLSDQALKSIARATAKLSNEQGIALSRRSLGQQFATLVSCGLIKNIDYTTPVQGLDSRQDAIFRNAYGINPGTNPSDLLAVTSTIAMNVIKGNTGPGAIMLGGYDYHDSTQTTGDGRDFLAGQQIGMAVQAAFDSGKSLVFQVLTDGGLASADGTRNWKDDSNEKGLTVVGVIRPQGAASMRKTQLGSFTAGQGADTTSLFGVDTKLVALSVFANYLSLSGKINLFESVVTGSSLSSTNLDQVLMFG